MSNRVRDRISLMMASRRVVRCSVIIAISLLIWTLRQTNRPEDEKPTFVQVHVPQKPQKKRVDIIFFLLVDFKNGFVSMKGCRKRGLPVGYYYFLPKIDRVLMLQIFLFFTICTPKTTKAKTRKRLQLIHLSL